jgi:hypothetical protein
VGKFADHGNSGLFAAATTTTQRIRPERCSLW